jgi:salicylate hydroxylase
MTNFQQLGPSQDIEDALILSAVLGLARADAPESVDAALYAYDAVRRPRSQWVSEHGKRLGMLWTGMVPEVGLDVGALRKAFLEWKELGEEFDAGKHREEAVRVMRRRWESGKPVGQEVLEL